MLKITTQWTTILRKETLFSKRSKSTGKSHHQGGKENPYPVLASTGKVITPWASKGEKED